MPNLSKKNRFLLILGIVIAVAAIGIGIWAYKTGKISSKADTIGMINGTLTARKDSSCKPSSGTDIFLERRNIQTQTRVLINQTHPVLDTATNTYKFTFSNLRVYPDADEYLYEVSASTACPGQYTDPMGGIHGLGICKSIVNGAFLTYDNPTATANVELGYNVTGLIVVRVRQISTPKYPCQGKDCAIVRAKVTVDWNSHFQSVTGLTDYDGYVSLNPLGFGNSDEPVTVTAEADGFQTKTISTYSPSYGVTKPITIRECSASTPGTVNIGLQPK